MKFSYIKYKLNANLTNKSFVSTVLRHGQAFSPIYRFSLSDGTMVSAHTKSKLMRSPGTNEPQLYMSLHILQRYVYSQKRTQGFDAVFVGFLYWQDL